MIYSTLVICFIFIIRFLIIDNKIKWFDNWTIFKPLLTCPTCMSWFYGGIGFLLYAQFIAATREEVFHYWIFLQIIPTGFNAALSMLKTFLFSLISDILYFKKDENDLLQ